MPTLTLRDVSPEVLSRLEELANRNGRSMEQEVKILLEQITSDRVEALHAIEATWTHREISKEEADQCLADRRGSSCCPVKLGKGCFPWQVGQ